MQRWNTHLKAWAHIAAADDRQVNSVDILRARRFQRMAVKAVCALFDCLTQLNCGVPLLLTDCCSSFPVPEPALQLHLRIVLHCIRLKESNTCEDKLGSRSCTALASLPTNSGPGLLVHGIPHKSMFHLEVGLTISLLAAFGMLQEAAAWSALMRTANLLGADAAKVYSHIWLRICQCESQTVNRAVSSVLGQIMSVKCLEGCMSMHASPPCKSSLTPYTNSPISLQDLTEKFLRTLL